MTDAAIRARLPGETEDSARLQQAVDSAPDGVVEIPRGEYELALPLRIRNRCSLDMHPAAHLKAKVPMDYVVVWDGNADYHALSLFRPDGSIYDNPGAFIRGGDVDGNGIAGCLAVTNAHHFTLANTVLHNPLTRGLSVGEGGGHIYELICTNVYCKTTMSGLAGNTGIWSCKSDAHFTDCIIVDCTTGVELLSGGNRLTRCHVWGGTVPPEGVDFRSWSSLYAKRKKARMNGESDADDEALAAEMGLPEMLRGSVAFALRGGNDLDGCYADTASVGFLVSGSTLLSNCGFFNNKLMGLRDSVAIRHEGGTLRIMGCTFSAPAGTERLYEGSGDNVTWTGSTVQGDSLEIPASFGRN